MSIDMSIRVLGALIIAAGVPLILAAVVEVWHAWCAYWWAVEGHRSTFVRTIAREQVAVTVSRALVLWTITTAAMGAGMGIVDLPPHDLRHLVAGIVGAVVQALTGAAVLWQRHDRRVLERLDEEG